jgi:hypothetical protein
MEENFTLEDEIQSTNESDKEWLVAVIFSKVFGIFGGDRFYLGYTGLGILKLITLGGCGIWYLIDLVLIILNKIPDSDGKTLKKTWGKRYE